MAPQGKYKKQTCIPLTKPVKGAHFWIHLNGGQHRIWSAWIPRQINGQCAEENLLTISSAAVVKRKTMIFPAPPVATILTFIEVTHFSVFLDDLFASGPSKRRLGIFWVAVILSSNFLFDWKKRNVSPITSYPSSTEKLHRLYMTKAAESKTFTQVSTIFKT